MAAASFGSVFGSLSPFAATSRAAMPVARSARAAKRIARCIVTSRFPIVLPHPAPARSAPGALPANDDGRNPWVPAVEGAARARCARTSRRELGLRRLDRLVRGDVGLRSVGLRLFLLALAAAAARLAVRAPGRLVLAAAVLGRRLPVGRSGRARGLGAVALGAVALRAVALRAVTLAL